MDKLVSLSEMTQKEVMDLIDMAMKMKSGKLSPSLKGKNLILLFFNPSLRTRTSFELAMQQLEGNVVTLNAGGGYVDAGGGRQRGHGRLGGGAHKGRGSCARKVC